LIELAAIEGICRSPVTVNEPIRIEPNDVKHLSVPIQPAGHISNDATTVLFDSHSAVGRPEYVTFDHVRPPLAVNRKSLGFVCAMYPSRGEIKTNSEFPL
jgi:hypothetical protein